MLENMQQNTIIETHMFSNFLICFQVVGIEILKVAGNVRRHVASKPDRSLILKSSFGKVYF